MVRLIIRIIFIFIVGRLAQYLQRSPFGSLGEMEALGGSGWYGGFFCFMGDFFSPRKNAGWPIHNKQVLNQNVLPKPPCY